MAFSLKKIFSWPKGNDPYKSMTKGSTGGWAAPYAKPAAFLPAAAALASNAIAPGFGWAVGGLTGAGQGLGTGIWGKPGLGSAIKGGLSGAGQGGFMDLGATGGFQNAANAIQGLGKAGASTAATIGSQFTPNYSNPFTSEAVNQGINSSLYANTYGSTLGNTTSSLYNAYNPVGSSIASQFTPSSLNPYTQSYGNTLGQSLKYTPSVVAGAGGEAAKGINWGQVAGGLATSALPAMFSQGQNQIPESAMYGDITTKLLGGKGISELGALSREKLTGNLNDQFSPVPDEYYNASTRRLDEAYDKAERDYTTQWQGTRPGSDVQGDSAYREGINKLRQDRAREKSGLAAELDYRREADYMDRQYQNIQYALNIDQQTMQDYMSLAQMDSERLAANTGITLGEANQFREIFGNLGGYLMQRGMGLNDPTSALTNIMKKFGMGV